jgi:hypothetical protein
VGGWRKEAGGEDLLAKELGDILPGERDPEGGGTEGCDFWGCRELGRFKGSAARAFVEPGVMWPTWGMMGRGFCTGRYVLA